VRLRLLATDRLLRCRDQLQEVVRLRARQPGRLRLQSLLDPVGQLAELGARLAGFALLDLFLDRMDPPQQVGGELRAERRARVLDRGCELRERIARRRVGDGVVGAGGGVVWVVGAVVGDSGGDRRVTVPLWVMPVTLTV